MNLLRVAWEALFPRRYYVTTQKEREAIAAQSRKYRKLAGMSLLAFPVLVVAALHLMEGASSWMPRVLR